jgi:UDP-N-acetylmuramate--alanine ligase
LIADAVPPGTAEVHYLPSLARVPGDVAELLRDGDLVITMGAGDVTMLGPELLAELRRRHGGASQEGW